MQAVLALLSVTEAVGLSQRAVPGMPDAAVGMLDVQIDRNLADVVQQGRVGRACGPGRSEEPTSELQSLMRISYAVFCLKKKKRQIVITKQTVHEMLHHSRQNYNTH